MNQKPLDEDNVVQAIASKHGLRIQRRDRVVITDHKAIKAQGLMRECPNYARIEKLLREGGKCAGAELPNRVEYILTADDDGGAID